MLAERCSLGGDTPPGTCRPYRAPRVGPESRGCRPWLFSTAPLGLDPAPKERQAIARGVSPGYRLHRVRALNYRGGTRKQRAHSRPGRAGHTLGPAFPPCSRCSLSVTGRRGVQLDFSATNWESLLRPEAASTFFKPLGKRARRLSAANQA